jgi:hypothetical protein
LRLFINLLPIRTIKTFKRLLRGVKKQGSRGVQVVALIVG